MSLGPNGEGLSRKHVMGQVRESLHRLQLDYVDIYYAHTFDFNPKLETLTTFNNLVRQGLVRYIGVSNIPTEHLVKYTTLTREWRLEPIAVLQYSYNLLNRDVERCILPLAKRFGIGFAAYSPLAEGLLTGKYVDFKSGEWTVPPGSRAEYRDLKHLFTRNLRVLTRLKEFAVERGVTMAQLACLAYGRWREALGIPIVSIVGVSRLEHLEEALAALDVNLSTMTSRRWTRSCSPPRERHVGTFSSTGGSQLFVSQASLLRAQLGRPFLAASSLRIEISSS